MRFVIKELYPAIYFRKSGLGHRIGHARVFFPDWQELAVAQTACRSSKKTLARPSCRGKLAETMIKAEKATPAEARPIHELIKDEYVLQPEKSEICALRNAQS
ncbi:MAG: hypothetical protein V2B19_09295 [Pseudomonadota bacterium]